MERAIYLRTTCRKRAKRRIDSCLNIEGSQEREGSHICGLIAGSGRIQAKYLIALGCLSEVRGKDSAGVGWWKNGEVHVSKVAQNPLVAFPSTLFHCFKAAAKHQSPLIGHTRQATHGAVTSENAHPFCVDNIAFAHNGIITNYRTFGDYEVDSQSLIHGIKERNFSKYYGNIALVWIEGGLLHAFRSGNPLFRGVRHRAIYLASLASMLTDIGCHKVKAISENHLYIFKGMKITSVKKIPANGSYERWTPSGHNHNTFNSGCGGYDWREKRRERHRALLPERASTNLNDELDLNNGDSEHLPIISGNGKSILDDQRVDDVEQFLGDEADVSFYEEGNLCYQCRVNLRAQGSVWCKVCKEANHSRFSHMD